MLPEWKFMHICAYFARRLRPALLEMTVAVQTKEAYAEEVRGIRVHTICGCL